MSAKNCGHERKTALIFPFMAPLYRHGHEFVWPMVRVMIGANLVPHGINKIFGSWGGSMEKTAQSFAALGLEPALPLAWLVALTELVGGLMLVFGLGTRLAAGFAAGFLAVATFHVHGPAGFWWTERGYEYPLMWLVLTLAVFLRGGGPYSLDRRLGREF